MTSVPTARTWTNGEATNAAMMSDISTCETFYMNPPAAHLYLASGMHVAFNTATLCNWDTAYYQNDNNWEDTANATQLASRLYFNSTGMYNISAGAMWTPGTSAKVASVINLTIARNAAGTRPSINSNLNVVSDTQTIPGGGFWSGGGMSAVNSYPPPQNHVDTQAYFEAGDYIEMWMKWWAGSTSTQRWIPGGKSAKNLFYLTAQWNGA